MNPPRPPFQLSGPSVPRRRHARSPVIWVGAIAAVVAPVVISVTAPHEQLAGALVAYLNLLVFGVAAAYFISSGTLQGLIPVIFLTWLEAAWPLASIYFATQCPEYAYVTTVDERQFLFRNLWVQTVTLAFVLAYLGTTFAFRGRATAWSMPLSSASSARRVPGVVLVLVIGAITLHAVSKVVTLPDVIQYFADGGYLYLHGLMFMVGALFLRLRVHTRSWALLFMGLAASFYVLGNARGQAGLPVALFLAGIVLLSDLKYHWKAWIVTVACVSFPLALVIANTTRQMTGTIGFGDLASRLRALGQWHEVVSTTPVLASTFGRLFFIGGHTIVTMSPEQFPFVDFAPLTYVWEFLTRLLPRRLMFDSYYSANPNVILMRYDFLVTEETSVPVSLIGSLYMLGGLTPVMLGGMAIAMFHCLVARCLGRLARYSPYLGLFVFAMIATNLLWAQNLDPITHVRGVVWAGVAAIVLYQLVLRPFLAEPVRMRRRRRIPRLVPRPV